MTASPGIAPLPRPHSWPIVLVLLFGTPRRTVFEGVPLSPSMTFVCRGQGCPWQYMLAVWILFVLPQTFLSPRHGPWARYEMGWGPQILWPHTIYFEKLIIELHIVYAHNIHIKFYVNQILYII